ncbi:MAG: nitroreductase family deazaflavin-dependent oxidoreductase [Acidimicrobiia bacterium]
MTRPSRLLKVVFATPSLLYRLGLGWMLGKRFLVLVHRGRKTGRLRETVLEAILFDAALNESVVVSAYGTRADWYQNLLVEQARRVRTGRLDYVPEQRFLDAEEARAVALAFTKRHPWEAKLIPRVLPAIGAAVTAQPNREPVEMLVSLPMVAFRPKR